MGTESSRDELLRKKGPEYYGASRPALEVIFPLGTPAYARLRARTVEEEAQLQVELISRDLASELARATRDLLEVLDALHEGDGEAA